jgi:cyanate lyase
MVYGQAIKAVIHEKVHGRTWSFLPQLTSGQFGDGIMSMIDCSVKIERKPDPKGDRVLLIFE